MAYKTLNYYSRAWEKLHLAVHSEKKRQGVSVTLTSHSNMMHLN